METFGRYLRDPVDMRILDLLSHASGGMNAKAMAEQIIEEGYRQTPLYPFPDSIKGRTFRKLKELKKDGYVIERPNGYYSDWYIEDEYKEPIKNLMDSYAALDEKLRPFMPYKVKYEPVSTLNRIKNHGIICQIASGKHTKDEMMIDDSNARALTTLVQNGFVTKKMLKDGSNRYYYDVDEDLKPYYLDVAKKAYTLNEQINDLGGEGRSGIHIKSLGK